MSIRVIIGDDHPVVRDGLRMTIESSGKDIAIVAEAADGMEVLKLARTTPADVFVLDITMPNLNGIETARELRKRFPRSKVIMLSLHDTKAMFEEALAAGARGYLTKEMATRNVIDAMTEVHAGHYFICPRVSHFLVKARPARKQTLPSSGAASLALTSQETKVLQLIAEGHTNKEIAARLQIAVNTVHVHRTKLMGKLNLHRQADLIRYALRAGIAKA